MPNHSFKMFPMSSFLELFIYHLKNKTHKYAIKWYTVYPNRWSCTWKYKQNRSISKLLFIVSVTMLGKRDTQAVICYYKTIFLYDQIQADSMNSISVATFVLKSCNIVMEELPVEIKCWSPINKALQLYLTRYQCSMISPLMINVYVFFRNIVNITYKTNYELAYSNQSIFQNNFEEINERYVHVCYIVDIRLQFEAFTANIATNILISFFHTRVSLKCRSRNQLSTDSSSVYVASRAMGFKIQLIVLLVLAVDVRSQGT